LPENLNKQRILDNLRHGYTGDVEQAVSYYDDDIDFIAYAPIEIFPALGQKLGKAAMAQSLVAFRALYDPIAYTLTSVVAEGERVAVSLDISLPSRDTGRVINTSFANFYTLRAGRIHIYRQFLDSFDAVQQRLRTDLSAQLKQNLRV
jgi:ketosteroid isomerase-like protein